MNNLDSAFYREIDKREKEIFVNNGNIQYLYSSICRNFEYLSHIDNSLVNSDDFYRILRKTVKRDDDPPIFMIITMNLFALFFSSPFLLMGMDGLGFLIFSIFLFCVANALLIVRIVKKNSILKCIGQGENVYAVSLPIQGTR